jgi:16S rRNA (cytosine1407-C5)-methyltransferase
MKRTSVAEKLAKKREVLVARTAQALDVTPDEARRLLLTGRQQSVRLNPLVAKPAATLEAMADVGWRGGQYPWIPEGYSVEAGLEALRDSQLVADGAAYIQNAASWLPVLTMDVKPDERVLDVCAAPGGKTTHIAAAAGNRAYITANDNSRARLMKLRATCQRLQASVEQLTLFDAQQLARKFQGEQFDKILLDAPCSGEGLMRLDRDKDFTMWSVAQIKRLQQLQKRILSQAWQLLKPGGTLVYSTCTMAPEENEAVIDYALRAFDGVRLMPLDMDLPNRVAPVAAWNGKAFNPEVQGCLRLKPSPEIEAFFVCKLTKADSTSGLEYDISTTI